MNMLLIWSSGEQKGYEQSGSICGFFFKYKKIATPYVMANLGGQLDIPRKTESQWRNCVYQIGL